MGRALGSNAICSGIFEVTPGTTPGSGTWYRLPFVSHTLGEERNLLSSDLLGQGREPQDPVLDVANNDGDIVVPVDVRNIGVWLKALMGAPTSTADDDLHTHIYNSGATTLPSMSIEIGNPEVPAYSIHRGARLNQLRIQMARSGLLNATASFNCIGESDPTSVSGVSGSPTILAPTRFAQASGFINNSGVALGSVTAADITISNNFEKVETIQPDGRIEDSDPGLFTVNGSISVRYKDQVLQTAARSNTPLDIDIGWAFGADWTLTLGMPRIFLPLAKRPISGPGGVVAQYNIQGSGQGGHALTATLVNDQAVY